MSNAQQDGDTIGQLELDVRERQAIVEWIEKNVNVRVTKVDRQRRWRPVWRVQADRDGVPVPLLVRGCRTWEMLPYPLEHEIKLMQLLEANGIPAPHVYGLMDFPKGFVMDCIQGGRDPALTGESIEKASTISPERWAASLKYMEILAKMHKIPPEEVEAAGNIRPVGAREVALNHVERFYRMCEESKYVDPFMDFSMMWLRRNVPRHRTRCTFVTGDCGQFLNEGEEVTAVLDVETGHLGDNLHDLACYRGRHPVENMGDLPTLFRHYAKAMGEELDLPVIVYHTVAFMTVGYSTPILALAKLTPGGDFEECLLQIAYIGRRSVEAMAEFMGVELEEIQLPEARVTPWEDLALNKLLYEINRLPTSENFAEWQRNTIAAIPRYLLGQAHYGRWLEEEDLREIGEFLGRRFVNLVEADKALKQFVLNTGPEYDVPLVKLFHHRMLRLCLMIAGPNAPKDHLLFSKAEPLLGLAK